LWAHQADCGLDKIMPNQAQAQVLELKMISIGVQACIIFNKPSLNRAKLGSAWLICSAIRFTSCVDGFMVKSKNLMETLSKPVLDPTFGWICQFDSIYPFYSCSDPIQ
jgi:hypothetical protein